MRITGNSNGFSLTEILIAVAIMGGIALVSLKLVDNQSNNERMLKSSAEVNKAVALIQGALSGDASCKNLLKGIVPVAAPGTQIPKLQTTFTNPISGVVTTRDIIVENTNYGAFYTRVGDIRFVLVGPTPAGTTRANLVVNFRVRKGNAKGNFTTDAGVMANDHVITKTLPVEFKASTNPTTLGQLLSCGAVMSEANELARQKFCASMDPGETAAELFDSTKGVTYWDSAAKKCNLRSMDCPWGQVPKEMTNLGSITCVDLETTMTPNSLRQIFNDTSCRTTSGNFSVTVGGDGRLKINCPP